MGGAAGGCDLVRCSNKFSTDCRFGSDMVDQPESSFPLEMLAGWGGTGFFLTADVDDKASKGDTKSNMDLRGEGGC